MRRLYLPLAALIIFTLILCSMSYGGGGSRAYYRPAVGPSVEKVQTREIALEAQSELKLDVRDGNITLTPWEGDSLQVKETKRLKAPGSRKSLEDCMDEYTTLYRSNPYDISISTGQPEKLTPFSRVTTDFEFKVPEKLRSLTITAVNGSIGLSGFDGLSAVDLKLETGTITAKESKAFRFDFTVKRGDIKAEKLEGRASFKAVHGNTGLSDIKGDIQLKTTSGDAVLKHFEGRADCDISKGSLEVDASLLRSDSSLYVSRGDISADVSGIDREGSYSFMTADGAIGLMLPEAEGFSLKAKSENGRVLNGLSDAAAGGLASDGRELSGRVGSGGPDINIYTDRGEISLSGRSS